MINQVDYNILRDKKIKEFKFAYPWWKKSMCAIIKYDDLGVPIEWTLKPKYAKNTVCFEGKDMEIKYAIKILDNRINSSLDSEERMHAESTRFTILMFANDFQFTDKF